MRRIVVGIHLFFLTKGVEEKFAVMLLCLTQSAHRLVIGISDRKQGKNKPYPKIQS